MGSGNVDPYVVKAGKMMLDDSYMLFCFRIISINYYDNSTSYHLLSKLFRGFAHYVNYDRGIYHFLSFPSEIREKMTRYVIAVIYL